MPDAGRMKKRQASVPDTPQPIERHYSRHDLQALGIGLSRVTLWRRVRAGTFPRPIDIGNRYVWRASDIQAWLDSRPRPGKAA